MASPNEKNLYFISLDLSKPIDLNIHDGGNTEEILTVLAPYIIEA